MGRTESKSIQVHPNDEQNQIELMQKFHWNLLSTQEIKVKDSHLEQRGDSMYSVTQTEHYVKLAFSRALDDPHLQDIRRLEQEFFSLERPVYPKLIPVHWILWLLLALVYGLGIALWLLYFFLVYQPKKASADALAAQNSERRAQILQDLSKYD